MLGVASRPRFECSGLDLADQPRRLRPLPQTGITVLLGPANPPPLARQPIGLADYEHRKLGLTASLGLVVDIAEHLAQLAHLRPAKMMAQQLKHPRIADRLAGLRRRDEDRPHLSRVGQQS